MIIAVILFWLLFILWAIATFKGDTILAPGTRSIILVLLILLLGLMCTGNPFAGITEHRRVDTH